MLTRRVAPLLALLALFGGAAAAQDRPLVCYGTEPSWSLDLQGGVARLKELGQEEVEFRGRATAVEILKIQAWRGGPAGGTGGELVAFLSETTCSDGMSDLKRPVTARVSLPDGRLLAGCCRVSTLSTVAGAPIGAVPAPLAAGASAPLPKAGPAAVEVDWTSDLPDYLSALRSCTFEALRTEAVHFAEKRREVVHLVLRMPGKQYVDCEAPASGPARLSRRGKNAALKPAEQAIVLTLLPGEPPRGACYRSEPAVDDRGNPFGWITRKGC